VGSIHIVAFLLFLAVVGWIFAVKVLGKQFNQLAAEQAAAPDPETAKEEPVLTTS
jgi:ATP/ADP translocase